jgi:hypothetical protein
MIINNAPQNEAVLSNVSEIGEFRIRNSAKAFNILSSGLYANKIRAIVRELSCNAIDSHVAAGKPDVPFDVHLPNTLEPWFSIRDYGTGLSHDQVSNIYTTYFESTKTASNEFIGALGLGSKSPFSYTDNFTVTAIKDGVKGIYSAFINEQGVPSIALMTSEQTDEPAGVEVKFSVNDRWDFDKFSQEASSVYKWFKLRPVVTGNDYFSISEMEYETENIIPGVHSNKRSMHRSMAVMGNIAYPIEVPNTEKNLGELASLLDCNLIMEFGIGELDFQASREGLSYIPQTIESIRKKLEAVNAVLATHVAAEADAIKNLWDRALYLHTKRNSHLWQAAVIKYVTDTDFQLFDTSNRHYLMVKHPSLNTADLSANFNIVVRGFEKSVGTVAASTLKPYREYDRTNTAANATPLSIEKMDFTVSKSTHFVINDTKVGALERAKHHFREAQKDRTIYKDHYTTDVVYVIEAFDKTKPIKLKDFLKAIHKPPMARVVKASSLMEKERSTGSTIAKNVTIMRLEQKGYGGYYRQRDMVWRDAGKASNFDATQTFYYMPLSGFNLESAHGLTDIKELANDLNSCGIKALNVGSIYGVRKGDIEFIKTQKNWINIEEHIAKNLKKIDTKLIGSFIAQELDNFRFLRYNSDIVSKIDAKSPYAELVATFKDAGEKSADRYAINRLIKMYSPKTTFDPEAAIEAVRTKANDVAKRYPLIGCISGADGDAVAEYINLIDAKKGI